MTDKTDKTHPRNRDRRANIQEIARRCGVHASTVSSVLAGKDKQRRISEAVAARVRSVAAEVDYSPNLLLHSLLFGRTHTLAFYNAFREHRSGDLYMDALKVALEREAGRLGYDILTCCDYTRAPEETYRHLNGGRSDGLILFKPSSDTLEEDPLLGHLRKSRMPLLLLNTVDAQGVLSSVRDDQAQGVRLVAESLLALGHRRIAMVTKGGFRNDPNLRVTLLREMLHARGVTVPDEWVVEQEDLTRLSFMEGPSPPTAVFCWHDQLGYRFLDCCQEAGVRVPEDLSVIGYDGLRWPSQTRHRLASVCVDLDLMGRMAVETLDALIRGESERPLVRSLPVHFDWGTTLAPPVV